MKTTHHSIFSRGLALAVGVLVAAGITVPATALSASAADPELSYQLAVTNTTTGTKPFDDDNAPGNDADAANTVIRAFDSVTYEFEASVNSTQGGSGTAANSTFTAKLPEGMTWDTLPGTCLTTGTPASGISADGRTATCNTGDLAYGATRGIVLTASVSGLPNDTTLEFGNDAISFGTGNATTPPVSQTLDTLTVSSVPNINMTKLVPYVAKNQVGPDGVTRGWILQYGVTLSIPDIAGKGRMGYLAPTGPISFTDDFSGISPNAQFMGVETGAVTNHGELPQWSVASLNLPNAINNGGTWKATNDAANQKVTVTISGADLSANHIPTVDRSGQPIVDKGYLTFGKVLIFVPLTDVEEDGTLPITNVVADLTANGLQADGSTLANVGDDAADNVQNQELVRQSAGEFTKRFADVINSNNTPYLVEGMTGDRSGTGTLVAGQQVQSFMSFTNTSPEGAYSAITVCDMWDSTQLSLAKYNVLPANRWENPTGNPTSATGTAASLGHFEYLTGYTLSGTDSERWQTIRTFSCADSAGTWTTQADALANPSFDLSTVSAVRWVGDTPVPAGATATMLVNLEAQTSLKNGQIVANMAGWQVPELNSGKYQYPNYVPETNKTSSGFTPNQGDRLTGVEAPLAVSKKVTSPVAATPRVAAGAPVKFELSPSFRTVGRPGPFSASDVTVTDRIPAGLQIALTDTTVNGTAVTAPSYTPESVTVEDDGTTVVVWRFDSISADALPTISYWAVSDTTSRGNYVNTVIIRSPDDAQSPAESDVAMVSSDPHRARATIGVDGQVGISVSKATLNPFISAGDNFTYTVTAANGSPSTTQTGGVLIDVLPFVGDGAAGTVARVPATDNTGQYTLSGEPVLPAGATAQYTTDPAAAVQAAQQLGAGQGPGYGAGITWLSFDQVQGDLAAVTAIRVALPSIAPLATSTVRYTLTHVSGVTGGVFANNATLRTSQAALGVVSNTVTTRLEDETPAIQLVKSASTPANGTEFVVGETVDYAFTVTNTGLAPLHDVTVDETSFVNQDGTALTLTSPITPSSPANFDGTLDVGASATFTATYVVTQADVDAGGNLTNAARTSGTPPTGAAVTDDSTVDVNMGDPAPAIELLKSTDTEPANGTGFVVGEAIDYTFTVRNTGNVTLSGVDVAEGAFTNGAGDTVKLTDGPNAPAGFSGELSPGEQAVFTGRYVLTQADIDAGGVLTNSATASGTDHGGTNVTDDSEAVTGLGAAVADIHLVKSASAPAAGDEFTAGETVTYTFTGTNTGAVTLHDVTLAEDSFVNGNGDALTLTTEPKVVAPAGFDGTLKVGDSVTYEATYVITQADIDAGGSIANAATITGTPQVGPAVDSTSDVSVNTGTPAPAISLEKTVSNTPADGSAFAPGETVEYAFTVRNTGNVTLRDVSVNEGSFTNAAGTAVKLTTGPIAADGFDGVLTPGQETVFTGTYRVTAADAGGELSNSATASGTPQHGDAVSGESTAVARVAASSGTVPDTGDNGTGGLALTGGELGGAITAAVLLLVLGAGTMLLRRRGSRGLAE